MIDFFSLQASDTFFRQISLAFINLGGLKPNESQILLTAILVLAASLGYALWKRTTSSGMHHASGSTVIPGEIANILEQAFLQRSRIDLSFHPISTSRQTIACALFELSANGVTLELPIGVNPSVNWIGKRMVCYFRIPQTNKPPYFYTFISSVTGVQQKKDIYYLVLAMPSKVELGQKRRHLRLEIPPQDIKDFRIWPATEDGAFHFESDPTSWPPPLAVYTREDPECVRIVDLSGGGIKLSFDPARYASLDDFVAQHPILFMRLELMPVPKMELPVFIVAARLRTKAQDMDSGTLMLGYEFVECCKSPAPEIIDWVKIEPEKGIDDLVTWVFKRHLELYREKEIV